MKLDKIKSMEYDKNRKKIFGIKSAIVWAHSNKTNVLYPVLYISKPKAISQEYYEYLLDRLEITIYKEPRK